MVAVICLFLPSLVLAYARWKVMGGHNTVCKNALVYAFAVLGLNFTMLVILYFGFGSKKELFYRLNTYNEFAIKYMLLSVVLAVMEPYAEKFMRERVAIEFRGGD